MLSTHRYLKFKQCTTTVQRMKRSVLIIVEIRLKCGKKCINQSIFMSCHSQHTIFEQHKSFLGFTMLDVYSSLSSSEYSSLSSGLNFLQKTKKSIYSVIHNNIELTIDLPSNLTIPFLANLSTTLMKRILVIPFLWPLFCDIVTKL
jgi:hypothetical protein